MLIIEDPEIASGAFWMFFPILHDFPGDKRFSKTGLKRQKRKISQGHIKWTSVLLGVRHGACSSNASNLSFTKSRI